MDDMGEEAERFLNLMDEEMDKEAERILNLTADEILREAIAEGRDIELEVSQVQAVIELAIDASRRKSC
jgi:hypothetical protein